MSPHDPEKLILAIDGDPDSRACIREALAGTEHRLELAEDGEKGLLAAMELTPDLIITAVELPGMDGWTLVKHVRCQPSLALVPFIFVTTASTPGDRLRGFQLGADDFVSKPLRPHELGLRVRGSLQRRTRIAEALQHHLREPSSTLQAGIGGALEQIGLPALLLLLEMERKTGVLTLFRRELSVQAAIYVREGRVCDARIVGHRPRAHADAVYELLRWDTGRFEFMARTLVVDDRIGLATADLLLEGARRIDGSCVR